MSIDFDTYKALEQLIGATDYSDRIIHYSRLQTLENILRSNELWFGHLSDMNDTSECKYFLSAIEPALNELIIAPSLDPVRDFLKQSINRAFSETFISSWCEYGPRNRDGSLPMWQVYGDDGQGIGIIVDSSSFQPSRLTPSKVNFFITNSRVKYFTKEEASSHARDVARRVSKGFNFENELNELMSIAIMLATMAPTVKHPSFEHEKEIRFISMDPIPEFRPMRGDVSISELDVRSKRRRFAQLPLRNYPEYEFDLSITNILKAVLVGPGADQKDRADAVRALLGQFDLSHVEVILSDIPYRSA